MTEKNKEPSFSAEVGRKVLDSIVRKRHFEDIVKVTAEANTIRIEGADKKDVLYIFNDKNF